MKADLGAFSKKYSSLSTKIPRFIFSSNEMAKYFARNITEHSQKKFVFFLASEREKIYLNCKIEKRKQLEYRKNMKTADNAKNKKIIRLITCLLYTSPSPRDS